MNFLHAEAMTALDALQRGATAALGSLGSTYTLHAPTPVTFTAITRQRYRNLPGVDAVITETVLTCRRSAFVVRPREGLDISQNGKRWRLAVVQPGEVDDTIELVIESEVK